MSRRPTIAALFTLAILVGASAAMAVTTVFINEIHYDNSSTDVGEFIEIAGPAGTDLTGWSLVLYNGNGNQTYDTDLLSGTLPDQCGGFGTLQMSYPTNGIQNGSPDGLALVDDLGTVIQFLSYEGTMTAGNGPAMGMTSTDIGVAEIGSAIGDSLQLGGTGTCYEDFVWGGPSADSPGACNAGQTFGAGGPATDMLINEVDADQSGTDAAEFVELFDGGSGNTDLSGLVVVLFNGSSDVSYNAFDLDGETTDGNGFFVLCGNAANVANCDLDVSPDTNLIQNGADAVALYLGDAADFPNGTAATATDLIDALVYDTNDGDDPGLLALLNAGQPQVNEDGGTDSTTDSNQRCPDGGTQLDTDTYLQATPTPGAANACGVMPPSDLLINEVDADQTSTDAAEFVELFDGGSGNTDLSGLVVVLFNGNSDVSYNAFDLDGETTDGNGFFVLCGNAANVANCDLDLSPNTNLIQNGADAVALYLGDAADFPNGTAVTTTNLVDALVYDTNEGDDAELLVLLNAGQPQVNEDGGTDSATDSNQRCANGAGGQLNTDTYLQVPPTPGVTNGCPVPELVINEIDYDQSGTDAMEFVELLNFGATPIDLDSLEVRLINGNGGAAYNTIVLPAVSLAAGDYYVICGSSAEVANCDLDVSPNTNLIQNGAPDAVAVFEGATLIDAVSYEGDVAGFVEGSGSGLEDNSGLDFAGISRFPDGVDTDQNNVDLNPRCITPGEANTSDNADCPAPPRLVLNEIDYDQAGTDAAEFIEIYNAGEADVDLDLYSVDLINGSGAAVYQSFDLPPVLLPPGDFFVLCANPATVLNCDLDVTPDTNLIQNGAPDAVALMLSGAAVDVVSYEGDVAGFVEGSGAGLLDDSALTGIGISRIPNGADTQQNNVDWSPRCITPGWPNSVAVGNCDVTREIYEIQGAGAASPFADQVVTTLDNIVTAVGPNGFFLQTPDARDDADPETSNGIYVFTGGAPGVAEGDQVDVTGPVVEFFGFTEYSNGPIVTVDSNANPLPAATLFDATVPSPDPTAPDCAAGGLECFEGMLITVDAGQVCSGNQGFGVDPIAEVFVTSGPTRCFREPGIEFPGMVGLPVWDGNPELFELDPDKLGLANDPINGGSMFFATGGLGFEFGGYELWPSSLTVIQAPLPMAVRARVAGEITVGTLNMFRLFDDVDDPADGGRDDVVIPTVEYQARLDKFCLYIDQVLDSPEILGVQEVESLTVLQALADRLANDATCGALVPYTPFLIEGNDIGTIDVGFLVRDTVTVDAITQLGAAELLTFDGSLLNDRPALLLEGRYTGNGADFPVAVMVNHTRSLSGIDGGSGPRVRQKRLEQAQSIAQKAQDFQTANPTVPLIIIGDLNAFQFSDSFVDVVGQMSGDFVAADNLLSGPDLVDPNLTKQVLNLAASEQYSFNFRGNSQVLDHALTTQAADIFVRDFEFGRGNSDAAEVFFDDPLTAEASSDHDGAALFLMTDFDGDGVPDDVDNCPMTANAGQMASDGDSLGDACDNCPMTTNEDQADGDTDGVGDVCDNCSINANADQADGDTDGVGDVCDNCPTNANSGQADGDLDGVGDVCDNCPANANSDQADLDMDEVGDLCDNCPAIPNADQADLDMDNIGDLCEVTNLLLNQLIEGEDFASGIGQAINGVASLDLLVRANISLQTAGTVGDMEWTWIATLDDPSLAGTATLVLTDLNGLSTMLEVELGPVEVLEIPTLGNTGLALIALLLALAGVSWLRRRG